MRRSKPLGGSSFPPPKSQGGLDESRIPYCLWTETLPRAARSRSHPRVHADEYAVSKDGMKLFGIMELETTFSGCRFTLGLRNSHNKTLALALTVGYRVMVCANLAFHGDFTPVMRKHTKNVKLLESLSLGVD